MKQCPKSHVYDERRYSQCPYCNNDNTGFQTLGLGSQMEFPKTMPIMNAPDDMTFPQTMPLDGSDAGMFGNNSVSPGGMSVTIALDQTESGIIPVRGWIVAIEGENKGTSFDIHSEQNSIGRGQKFDINISSDNAVSSEGNAVIAYDSQNRKFFITSVPGKGKNNIYVNDTLLLMPMELKDYDMIKLGSSTYVFRTLCNEKFTY